MDFDFALVLVVVVFAGIIVLLVDLMLGRSRRQAIAQLQHANPKWQDPTSPDAQTYAKAAAQFKDPLPVEYAKSFLPVFAAVLVLRSFLVEPFQIPSSSMVPSLAVGDFILVNKFAYGVRLPVVGTKVLEVGEPQRGDVMVFFPPNDPRYFIKRVIGLPGDKIQYSNKRLYINGELISEELLAELPAGRPTYQLANETLGDVDHEIRKELYRFGPDNLSITVKPGHYFMMGDNRDNSSDSRVWGLVPEANVVGKAFAIWMHWDNLLSVPSFDRVGTIR